MKIHLLLVIPFIFVGNSFASEDAIILQIRQEYKSIRTALPKLTVQTVSLEDYSAEGGGAKAYRNASGQIRFIRAEFFGESGKVFEEYYYKDGKLIFVFKQRHQYNTPFNVTAELAKELGTEPFDPKKRAF